MLPLTPCPLASDSLLAAILAAVRVGSVAGVWFGGQPRPLSLGVVRGRRRWSLAVAGDLGWLVRRCPSVVVRAGPNLVAVPADDLIRMRVLRIVAGLPYLPTLETFQALFPGALGGTESFAVPLRERTAEEVLAACAGARIPVVRSRVDYDRRFNGGPTD